MSSIPVNKTCPGKRDDEKEKKKIRGADPSQISLTGLSPLIFCSAVNRSRSLPVLMDGLLTDRSALIRRIISGQYG